MAGTVTATTNNKKVISRNLSQTTRLYEFTVVSDSSGDVSGSDGLLPYIEGRLEEATIQPDETDTPTTLFDVYLYNDNTAIKVDLFGAEGENIDNTADKNLVPWVGSAFKDIILPRSGAYLVCENMGDTKKFTLQLKVVRG